MSGVVKHGIAMAEKASKNVFEAEAFVLYDESVRERAGEVGPSAFSVVVQEDALRFFSCENMKKSRTTSKASTQSTKKKSDKLCIRFNDGGCSAENCHFLHKCVACGSDTHGSTPKEAPTVNL